MTKHTPFPWTMVVGIGSKSGKYRGNYEIAEACEGEHEGNLALIEAIPDLLAACEAVEPFLDAIVCYASAMNEHDPNRIAVAVRAAVAKAKA